MDLLDQAILGSMSVNDIKIATLNSVIRRIDRVDSCADIDPGLVMARDIIVTLIGEIQGS